MKDIIDYLLVLMGFKDENHRKKIARENFERNLITIKTTQADFGVGPLEGYELTQSLREAIVRKVEDFTQNSRSFTAFDITTAIRTDGWNAVHAEVKEIVHELFDSGLLDGYNRELRDMGGPIEAWMYQPDVKLPSDGVSRIPAPQPANTTVNRPVDGRHTVSIPSSMTKRIGFKPGDRAWVHADRTNGRLVVQTSDPDLDGQVVAKYTVDKSNNIRITESTQSAAGLTTQRFSVEVQNGTIVLKAG